MTYGTPMAPSEGRNSAALGTSSTAAVDPRPRSLSGSMMLAVRETLCDQIADLHGQLIRQARALLSIAGS
jgi:hypothetical protein